MRKLIYVLMGVIILYLISVIYRNHVTPILIDFPVKDLGAGSKDEVRLNLVLFFSRKNCPPCVQQVVNFLNQPPENVRVIGIVKEEELNFLNEIKAMTGAKFPIKTLKKWKKYRPNYAPTLYGVDEFMRKAGYLLQDAYSK